jgi:ATP-dependent DNA helicase Q4
VRDAVNRSPSAAAPLLPVKRPLAAVGDAAAPPVVAVAPVFSPGGLMGVSKRIKRHSSLLLFAERSNGSAAATTGRRGTSGDHDRADDNSDDATDVDDDDDDDACDSAPPTLFSAVMASSQLQQAPQQQRQRAPAVPRASASVSASGGGAKADDLLWGLPGQTAAKAKPNFVKMNLKSGYGRGDRRRRRNFSSASTGKSGGGGGQAFKRKDAADNGLSSAIDADVRLQLAVREALQEQPSAAAGANASTSSASTGAPFEPALPLAVLPSDAELRRVLKQKFGHDEFRDGQLEVIRAVLRGESTLAVLATGSGKSLCYQLPAILAHGVVLVVSPLVALMADQVAQQSSAVRGALLSGQQSSAEAADVIRRLLARQLDVLYVAPERLMSTRFVDLLRRVPIAFACVDEAHCVAAWSHNFRPCYLRLRAVLCDELRVGTLLAVTATATRATETSICAALGIAKVVRRSAARRNLRLTASREPNRHAALVALLRGELAGARALIVYCAFKRQVDEVTELLTQYEFDAAAYHGDKSSDERTRTQRRFRDGKLRIVVATVAFGMGLNKMDVDAVVHFTLPRSLEHYVQETGRAGRDGRAALCHVFVDDDDYTHLRSVTHSDNVDARELVPFVRSVAAPAGAVRGAAVSVPAEAAAEQLDVRAPVIDTLLAVLEQRGVVRRLAPTLATCRLSFVSAPLAQLAEQSALLAAAKRCGREATGGDFDVPLDALARAMQCPLDDVRAELRRLEANQDIVCTLINPAYACEIVAQPAADDALAAELAQYMSRLEASQVQKLDFAFDLFKRMVSRELDSDAVHALIEAYFDSDELPPARARAAAPPATQQAAWLKADVISCIRDLRSASDDGQTAPSARVVARILHALPSGKYPTSTWARSPFWGKHRATDFNSVLDMAAATLDAMSAATAVKDKNK